VQNLQWIASGNLLTYGGFLLLGGRAVDLLGRRRLFVAGTLLFGTSSLACGLATSEGAQAPETPRARRSISRENAEGPPPQRESLREMPTPEREPAPALSR
jgi:MFS family permease